MPKPETVRYGIGEWYGQLFTNINPDDRKGLAGIKGVKKVSCPHRKDIKMCNKTAGYVPWLFIERPKIIQPYTIILI
jgi:hypothetical protein